MSEHNNDVFYLLLKLKSYLLSLIDSNEDCDGTLNFTKEFLERKHPEVKDHVIKLLVDNGIQNDCEIVFNEKIQFRFKQIAEELERNVDLKELFNSADIDAHDFMEQNKLVEEYKKIRERKLKQIVGLLINLAKIWSARSKLEKDVDDYSLLDEEELLRPSELKKLKRLDENTTLSYDMIISLTKHYLKELADYYFEYGGNESLDRFLRDIDSLRNFVSEKYEKLFEEHGLKDPPAKN